MSPQPKLRLASPISERFVFCQNMRQSFKSTASLGTSPPLHTTPCAVADENSRISSIAHAFASLCALAGSSHTCDVASLGPRAPAARRWAHTAASAGSPRGYPSSTAPGDAPAMWHASCSVGLARHACARNTCTARSSPANRERAPDPASPLTCRAPLPPCGSRGAPELRGKPAIAPPRASPQAFRPSSAALAPSRRLAAPATRRTPSPLLTFAILFHRRCAPPHRLMRVFCTERRRKAYIKPR